MPFNNFHLLKIQTQTNENFSSHEPSGFLHTLSINHFLGKSSRKNMMVKEKSYMILQGYIILFSIVFFSSFLKGELMCHRKQNSGHKVWLCWEEPIEFISSTDNQAAKWVSFQCNVDVYIKQSAPTCTLLNKVSDGSRKYVSSQIVTVVTGVILHWETFALLASWFFF